MTFFDQLCSETEREQRYLLGAPIIQRALSGDITLAEYQAFLTQAYHHVKHTTPLLMRSGSRIAGNQEWLRKAIIEYINEEYGTSVKLATQAARQIQTKLKLPDSAFSYLLSHGDLDQDHVQFFESLMNKVSDEPSKRAIISTARHVYRLYGDMFRAIPELAS